MRGAGGVTRIRACGGLDIGPLKKAVADGGMGEFSPPSRRRFVGRVSCPLTNWKYFSAHSEEICAGAELGVDGEAIGAREALGAIEHGVGHGDLEIGREALALPALAERIAEVGD